MAAITRHLNTSLEKKKIRRLMNAFVKQMTKTATQHVIKNRGAEESLFGWDKYSDENLLNMRRRLVRVVKEGVHERQNKEEEIALVAAMVWFLRLKQEERDRMMEW